MRVALGADHRGFRLKDLLARELWERGYQVVDLGTDSRAPVDYPDYAEAVAHAVSAGGADLGILVCGSGVGVSVAANKVRGIRAALAHDTYSARQGVEHDDMNVLVLGARVVGDALAAELVHAFLGASFTGEDRYRRRLDKIRALEDHALGGSREGGEGTP